MSAAAFKDLIARARAVTLEAEIERRGIALRGHIERCGPCPRCGGRDRFSINVNKQVWNCRGCGVGRDVIKLVEHLDGRDLTGAVKQLVGDAPLSPLAPEAAAAQTAARAEAKRRREAAEAAQHRNAGWLWSQRRAPQGTVVETYLRGRGYCGAIPPTLGFLPPRDNYPPAMIAAYCMPREIDSGELNSPLKVKAVQLTRLLPDASDRVREKNGKITIGRPLGMPIAVSSITDGLSLAITEGVEDALAYAVAGFAAWAAGSAPFLSSIMISDFITTVIIEAHPDAAAQQNISELVARLRGRPVRRGERPVKIILREAISEEGQCATSSTPPTS